MSAEYNDHPAADWARRNLTTPVAVRPLFSSRIGKLIVYCLCFCVPGAFFALGIVAFLLGIRDRYVVGGSIFFGFLLLIPSGLIAILGLYVRGSFVKSLDAEGVNGPRGQRFTWAQLCYVDHVTKHVRAGNVSHRIKDNQIELVFTNGKLVVPPLIHDRAAIWALIAQMPVEVRDDGVIRSRPDPEKALLEFLNLNQSL